MPGAAGKPETSTHLVVDFIRKRNRLRLRHTRELRRGAERPVGLGAVGPHPLPDPTAVHALPDGVDHTRTVTVRDDPRVAHRGALPAGALLGVAWVDPGERE